MEKYQKIQKIMLANETYSKLWELNAQYLLILQKLHFFYWKCYMYCRSKLGEGLPLLWYLLCKTHLFPGEDMFQVRGQNGLLLNSMTPVPVLAGEEQIQSTADQALETFYPIAPTIDLQCTHVYQEKNDTGHSQSLTASSRNIATGSHLLQMSISQCFFNQSDL